MTEHPMDTTKSHFQQTSHTYSPKKLVAVVTVFPITGFFLILSSLILTGTLIGLAVSTPLFILFSPILVPAFLTIGLAVTGFIVSGAFGISGLSSLTYIMSYLKRMRANSGGGWVHDQLDYSKRRAQATAGSYVGQKVTDVGHRTQQATAG
uniref:oleosin H2-like n=1 Tax=Erigeron canadensis TaxID=72917 RepID=UPI001CB8A390|nr:oleosin H2-like [Erigeron canadensis]